MIDLHGGISIPFLKKSRFTGSYLGMRYQLQKLERTVGEATAAAATTATEGAAGEAAEKAPARTETVLLAIIWPEPFNFDVTPEEKKHSREFPFTTDGIWEAVAWLNEEHEAGHY